jgi:uncharacterized membrane protein
MSMIEKSIEVAVPVRKAYDQWTQFEEFPRFMEGVEEVRQVDDTHLHWKAKVAGKTLEWDAEILEQVPDSVISWRSTSGARNDGIVRFWELGPDRCRISLSLDVDPKSLDEKIGDALGFVSARVKGDLERFKAFIEARPVETGAWRGEVHEGQVVRPPEKGA